MFKAALITSLNWTNGSELKPARLPDSDLFIEYPDFVPTMTSPYSGWIILDAHVNYGEWKGVNYFLEPSELIDQDLPRIKYVLIRDEWANAVKKRIKVKGKVCRTDDKELLYNNLQRTIPLIDNPSKLNIIDFVNIEKVPSFTLIDPNFKLKDSIKKEFVLTRFIVEEIKKLYKERGQEKINVSDDEAILKFIQPVTYVNSWKTLIEDYINKLQNDLKEDKLILSKANNLSGLLKNKYCLTPEKGGNSIGTQKLESHEISKLDFSNLEDIIPIEPINLTPKISVEPQPGIVDVLVDTSVNYRPNNKLKLNYVSEADNYKNFNFYLLNDELKNPSTNKNTPEGTLIILDHKDFRNVYTVENKLLKPFFQSFEKTKWLDAINKNDAESKKIIKKLKTIDDNIRNRTITKQDLNYYEKKLQETIKRKYPSFDYDRDVIKEIPKNDDGSFNYELIFEYLNGDYIDLWSDNYYWAHKDSLAHACIVKAKNYIKVLLLWQSPSSLWVFLSLSNEWVPMSKYLKDVFDYPGKKEITDPEIVKSFWLSNKGVEVIDKTTNIKKYNVTENDLKNGEHLFDLVGTDYYLIIKNNQPSLIYKTTDSITPITDLFTLDVKDKLKDLSLLELINQQDTLQINEKTIDLKDRLKHDSSFIFKYNTITPDEKESAFEVAFIEHTGHFDYIKTPIELTRKEIPSFEGFNYIQYENLLIEQQRLKEDKTFKKRQLQLTRFKEDRDWDLRWETYNNNYAFSIANTVLGATTTLVGGLGAVGAGVKTLGGMGSVAAAGRGISSILGGIESMMKLNINYKQLKEDERHMMAMRVFENHMLDVEHQRKMFDNKRTIRYLGTDYRDAPVTSLDLVEKVNKKLEVKNKHLKIYTPTEAQLKLIEEHYKYHGVECFIDDVTISIDESLNGIWQFSEIEGIETDDILARQYLRGILGSGIRVLDLKIEYGEPINKIQPYLLVKEINKELERLNQQYKNEDFIKVEAELANTKRELINFAAIKRDMEAEIEKLKEKADDGRKAIKDLEDLKQAYKKLKDECNEGDKEKITQLENQIKEINKQIQDKENKLKEADNKLRAAAADAHNKTLEVNRLNEQITALTNKKEELEGKILEANRATADERAKVAQLTTKKEELDGQLLEANRNISRLTKEKEKLGSDLDDCIAERDTFKEGQDQNKQQLENRIAALTSDLNKKKQDINTQKTKIQSLTNQNKGIQRELIKARADLEACQEGKEDIKELQRQKKEAEDKITELRGELQQCNTNLAAANRNLETYRKSLENKEAALTQANNQANLYRDEVEKLKKSIANKTRSLAEMNKILEKLAKGEKVTIKKGDFSAVTEIDEAKLEEINNRLENNNRLLAECIKNKTQIETDKADLERQLQEKETALNECQENITRLEKELQDEKNKPKAEAVEFVEVDVYTEEEFKNYKTCINDKIARYIDKLRDTAYYSRNPMTNESLKTPEYTYPIDSFISRVAEDKCPDLMVLKIVSSYLKELMNALKRDEQHPEMVIDGCNMDKTTLSKVVDDKLKKCNKVEITEDVEVYTKEDFDKYRNCIIYQIRSLLGSIRACFEYGKDFDSSKVYLVPKGYTYYSGNETGIYYELHTRATLNSSPYFITIQKIYEHIKQFRTDMGKEVEIANRYVNKCSINKTKLSSIIDTVKAEEPFYLTTASYEAKYKNMNYTEWKKHFNYLDWYRLPNSAANEKFIQLMVLHKLSKNETKSAAERKQANSLIRLMVEDSIGMKSNETVYTLGQNIGKSWTNFSQMEFEYLLNHAPVFFQYIRDTWNDNTTGANAARTKPFADSFIKLMNEMKKTNYRIRENDEGKRKTMDVLIADMFYKFKALNPRLDPYKKYRDRLEEMNQRQGEYDLEAGGVGKKKRDLEDQNLKN